MNSALAAALERATTEAWPEGNEHFEESEVFESALFYTPDPPSGSIWKINPACQVLEVAAATAEACWRRLAEKSEAEQTRTIENTPEYTKLLQEIDSRWDKAELWAAVGRLIERGEHETETEK